MSRKLFIVVATVLSLVACRSKKPHSPVAPPLRCETTTVLDTVISVQMRFVSELFANSTATIEPRINGYLVKKNFKKGMPVVKGQVLYLIDPTQINTTMIEAEANFSSAEAALVQAKNNYDRAVPLARINAISGSSLDEYRATYAAAQASLRSAGAALENARLNRSYTTVRAPASGVISDNDASVGDWVGVGTKYATLNTISNIDSVSVKIAIPVNEYLSVRERDSLMNPTYDNSQLISDAEIRLSDGTVYLQKGVYSYTESTVDAATGSIVISIKFANAEGALKPGQYAHVTASIGRPRRVLALPQQCVSQQQGANSLYTVSADSSVHFTKVSLGDTFDNFWIIREGVAPGIQVLVTGQQKVRSGTKIIPVPFVVK